MERNKELKENGNSEQRYKHDIEMSGLSSEIYDLKNKMK